MTNTLFFGLLLAAYSWVAWKFIHNLIRAKKEKIIKPNPLRSYEISKSTYPKIFFFALVSNIILMVVWVFIALFFVLIFIDSFENFL